MGIPMPGNYTHTCANSHVYVGLRIVKLNQYPHTDANRYIYVGMGIVRLGQYSRTAANQAATTLKSTAWAG